MKKISFLALLVTVFISFSFMSVYAEATVRVTKKETKELKNLENVFKTRIEEYRNEKSSNELLKKLEILKGEVNNSRLNHLVRGSLVEDIDILIKNTKIELNSESKKINVDEIKKAITVNLSNERVYLHFPEVDKAYQYQFVVTNTTTNKILLSSTINSGEVDLPSFHSKTNIHIAVSILNKDTKEKLESFSVVKEVNDNKPPTIEYAYVDNGYVYVEYKDNYQLSSTPLGHKLNGDKYFSYVEEARFRVKIPSNIIIIVEDSFGNTTSQSFNIKEDNFPLTPNVPNKILYSLEKNRLSDIETFRYAKNIVIAEYGKELDFIDTFENLFKDSFKRYRERDLIIKSNGLLIDNDIVKLNKEGTFLFKVSLRGYEDQTIPIYIIVNSQKRVNTNIEKIIINNPYLVKQEKIKLADYITFEPKQVKEKINSSFIFAKTTGDNMAFPIRDTVILKEGKHTSFEIIDLLTGARYPFDIKFSKMNSSKTKSFIDVTNKHWAYNNIHQLTSQGVLAGYPDGSFKPNLNITVREFSTILSRYLAQMPSSKVKPFENEISFGLTRSDWGYLEVKSILERIPKNTLYNFNTNHLDRYITREEVAFLVANTINFKETSYIQPYFTDAIASRFYYEIQVLFNNGILGGYPNNTFKPFQNISRAEVCAMLGKI